MRFYLSSLNRYHLVHDGFWKCTDPVFTLLFHNSYISSEVSLLDSVAKMLRLLQRQHFNKSEQSISRLDHDPGSSFIVIIYLGI